MLIRALIIDDEQKGIDALKILINRFIEGIKVIAESTNASEGIEMIENFKPDIVFLDINMPEMNGFELLEKLTWKDFNLVFTTAHQEYALKALKNNAVDYLLKPIDHEDLSKAVSRITEKIKSNENFDNRFNYNNLLSVIKSNSRSKIIINSKAGIESLETNDIICLESMSNYTRIYLPDSREILTSKTMKEFESILCLKGQPFMRIHHSYIINLHKVARYIKSTDSIVMNNDQKIPLAKSKRDAFFNWLEIE
ncbi:MAG: LytTR family DNA-binding domain-containing protein [Bacteroidota bacterium]